VLFASPKLWPDSRVFVLALVFAFVAVAHASAATWTTQTTPNPAGTNMTLRSVACPSAEYCVAVGQYTSGGSIVTLGEHWAGTTWSIDTTPTPGSGVDTLQAISCTSTSACTATGSVGSSRLEVPVERWDGRTWRLQTTPERLTTNLEGVECYSAEGCLTVAGLETGALSELWNGSEWRTVSVPNPPLPFGGRSGEVATRAGRFASVSCVSSSFCLAVGRYGIRYAEIPEFYLPYPSSEEWNGREWTFKSIPTVTEYVLQDVSCASSTFCMAVGQRNEEAMLAMSWNGREWTVRETPRFETRSILTSVSCTSSTSCIAVGWSNAYSTRALQWDGTRWTSQTVPNPGRGGILNEVACTSSTVCTAVGHYIETSGSTLTLALRYQ
jgi:hypothetical protein